jgi:hypothetical protein
VSGRRAALTLALAALLLPAGAASAPPVDARAADRGAAWLARIPATSMPAGQQADAIVALRAAGASRARLRARLRALARATPGYVRTPGSAAKVAIGAAAAGASPRRLGGVDLLARVRADARGGRFAPVVFDQALAVVALRAGGRPVPRAAVGVLRRARGAGGWGFSFSGGRDAVDITALVIEAMRCAGVPSGDRDLRAAAAWMLAQRNRAGGYASAGAGGPTEANATAGVIRALRALGRSAPVRTRAALRSLQERDGGVRFTAADAGSRLLATNDAVVALAGGSLASLFPPS